MRTPSLDAIEKAIRNAFEKGNVDDRAFREKVYRSAFAALDRALMANPGVTVEAAIRRRKAMQAKIAEIESEFLPAVAPASPEAPSASAGTPAAEAPAVEAVSAPMPEPEGRLEPTFGATPGATSGTLSAIPDITSEWAPPGLGSGGDDEVAPDRDERRIHGRRLPLGAIFFGVVILAAIGFGMWWATQTGLFRTLEGRGQTQTSAPMEGEEDYSPEPQAAAPRKPGEADQDRGWIEVFSPADPTQVSAPSDARAEVMQDDSGTFLRIRSGSTGSAVSFDVGQGVLDRLAGKHAVFDIVARAEDGKDTQMSVDCNFGELGDCGRKRYGVGHERNEYLFEVEFPAKQPGAAGTIAINSDFERQGRAVDIYAIRVSTAQ